MRIMLHHTSISVTDFEWHIQFFKEVFHMHEYRVKGEAPNRSIWFSEGIQLDELPDGQDDEMRASFPAHIAFQTDDLEVILSRAYELGCKQYKDKHHWFVMPNGLKVEIKENPPVVLDVLEQP